MLLQVKITPVLSLKEYIPGVQETFRKKGFPRYSEGLLQRFGIDEKLSPGITRVPRFEFYDKDMKTGILLQPDAITVHTNRYTSFEDFQRIVQLAAATLKEKADIALVERVGLRYVNCIRPDDAHPLTYYLKPGLHGLSEAELGVKTMLLTFAMNCSTNLGTMLIRLYQQKGSVLPFDVQPINLSYTDGGKADEVVSLLDLDHFSEQSFDFDVEAICGLGWKLHDPLDLAFRNAVTPEALKMWRGTDEEHL